MTTFEFSNRSFESQFVPLVEDARNEVSELLEENTPVSVHIKFTDNGASPDTGVGGFAGSSHQVNLAVLEGYDDANTQKENLRGVVYHELFHLRQEFTYDKAPFTAIHAAIYEGCSLLFEQQYAAAPASYGSYDGYSDEELGGWLEEIRSVGFDYFKDKDTWEKWAFYHPEYNEKWLIYKVGSWLVRRILDKNQLDVLDVKDMNAEQILMLDMAEA